MNFSKWSNVLKLILLKVVDEIERRINEKNGVESSDSLSYSIYTSLKFIVLEQVDGMVDEVVDYSKKQIISLSELLAQKISVILASLVYVLILVGLIFLIFIYLTISLALYLGDVLGEAYFGFLTTGGIITIIMLIIYFTGHKSISEAIKKHILKSV